MFAWVAGAAFALIVLGVGLELAPDYQTQWAQFKVSSHTSGWYFVVAGGLGLVASGGFAAWNRLRDQRRPSLTPAQADRHLDELKDSALQIYAGGLKEALALGNDPDRTREILMGHSREARKPLKDWERRFTRWSEADDRVRARARSEEVRLGLNTIGFWDVLYRVAQKHAIITGLAYGETIHAKDGAIWVVLSDGDHAIAHFQTEAERDRLLGRLQKSIRAVGNWKETKRLRDAHVSIGQAKGELAAALDRISGQVVLVGSCSYCRG